MRLSATVHLVLALVGLTGTVLAAEPAAPTNAPAAQPPAAAAGSVRPEVWTTNFPEAFRRAQAERRPLLVIGGLAGCTTCQRMEKSLEDRIFQCWAKGTGVYLARFHVNGAKTAPEELAAWKFLEGAKKLTVFNKPFAGLYYPGKTTNEDVRVAFTYNRGMVPGGTRHPSQVVEYILGIESLAPDYFKGLGKRPTVDELLAASSKKIAVACEGGEGKVEVEPADGRLVSGQTVKVSVAPARGYSLVGWRLPDGTLQKGKRKKTLKLPYSSDEGTYTAVLEPR